MKQTRFLEVPFECMYKSFPSVNVGHLIRSHQYLDIDTNYKYLFAGALASFQRQERQTTVQKVMMS